MRRRLLARRRLGPGLECCGLKKQLPGSVVTLLQDLVRIPSVNPAFAGDRSDLAGEERMVGHLEGLALAAGLRVKRQRVVRGRDNLLVTLPARGRRRHRVILAPHLDTIGAGNEQLTGKRIGNRIHGRGACDTKGCVAAMFSALLELASDAQRPEGLEVLFAGLADEENEQLGSRAFARRCPDADLAIIGEPTRLRVVTAHKGDFWLQIETEGKAAHGSRPELGRNAVKRMAAVILGLESDYATCLKSRRHPLLGHPTINVGWVNGGSQPNVVPDRCQIQVDRRTLPGERWDAVKAEIIRVGRAAGVRVKVTNIREHVTPALETDPELPAVQAFMKATGQRRAYGVDFFCDAALIAESGVPCVVYGPGDIAQAHTADEWIAISSLETGTKRLLRYLRSFG